MRSRKRLREVVKIIVWSVTSIAGPDRTSFDIRVSYAKHSGFPPTVHDRSFGQAKVSTAFVLADSDLFFEMRFNISKVLRPALKKFFLQIQMRCRARNVIERGTEIISPALRPMTATDFGNFWAAEIGPRGQRRVTSRDLPDAALPSFFPSSVLVRYSSSEFPYFSPTCPFRIFAPDRERFGSRGSGMPSRHRPCNRAKRRIPPCRFERFFLNPGQVPYRFAFERRQVRDDRSKSLNVASRVTAATISSHVVAH